MEILKDEYWSKSDAFLLPLTGIPKKLKYKLNSYLFWKDYSINNCQLIVSICYENYDEFLWYCKDTLFPIWDRKGYLIESHDMKDRTVFILDISEWAMDIEMFLAGRYSMLTKEAKNLIEKYHQTKYNQCLVHVYTVLYPNIEHSELKIEGKASTPIEYVAKNYGLPLAELKKLSEIGSIYDEMTETLITDIDVLCQDVVKV